MRKQKKSGKRIFAAVLCVLLAFLMILPMITTIIVSAGAVTESEIQALEKQAEAMEAEKKALKAEIAALKKDKNKALNQKTALDKQNAVLENQITNLESQITLYEQMIAEKETHLAETIAQEEAQELLFRQRVRAMEERGKVSYLEVLFQSADFGDLLERAFFIGEVMEADQAVMESLAATRIEIENTKAGLEENKVSLSAQKVNLSERQNELEDQINEAWALVKEITSETNESQADLKKIEAEEEAVQKEIDRLVRELAAQNGGTVWGEDYYLLPLKGYTRISSDYGYRTHPVTGKKQSFHGGIDLPAPKNTPILATRSGKVILSTYNSSYGNYVVIDHGDGVTTLYAHMNKKGAKVGTVVKQGDVIGYVGTTGSSTGYHLHLEVRENGNRQDPKPYYPHVKFTR